MTQAECRNFEDCNASICPLANNLWGLIWYPDEDICMAKRFQTLRWVKKQKAIARASASNDRYFTVEMLRVVRQVRKGIEGINPDQPLQQAKQAEQRWIVEKQGGRVIAKQDSEPCQVTRETRRARAHVGRKPVQQKGGQDDI